MPTAQYSSDKLVDSVILAEKGLALYAISDKEEHLAHVLNLAYDLSQITGQIKNGSFDSESAAAIENALGDRYKLFGDLTLSQKVSCLVHDFENVKREQATDLVNLCSVLALYLADKKIFGKKPSN